MKDDYRFFTGFILNEANVFRMTMIGIATPFVFLLKDSMAPNDKLLEGNRGGD